MKKPSRPRGARLRVSRTFFVTLRHPLAFFVLHWIDPHIGIIREHEYIFMGFANICLHVLNHAMMDIVCLDMGLR